MSLAKRLQKELAGTELPWTPPKHPAYARLINEIILAEESDEDGTGSYCSHFSFYRQAMAQGGASGEAIDGFLHALTKHPGALQQAIDDHAPSPEVARFVQHTMATAQDNRLHVVAGVFFYGREDVIPVMFDLLTRHVVDADASFAPLQAYLQRHIDLDGDNHGPLAAQMLTSLCLGLSTRHHEATQAACKALRLRYDLFTGIEKAIAQR